MVPSILRRLRVLAALGLTFVWVGFASAPVLAADPSEVRLYPPEALLGGILYTSPGGSWRQISEVHDGELDITLTADMPSPPADAQGGPVVVFWQLREWVAQALSGDASDRIAEPPIVAVLQPDCDSGGCPLTLQLSGSTASVLAAADSDSVSRTGIELSATFVRTFDDGALVQVMKPEVDVPEHGIGGTLQTPSDMSGHFLLSDTLPTGAAVPAEIPGYRFGYAADEKYDWGAVVTEVLRDPSGTPTARPKTPQSLVSTAAGDARVTTATATPALGSDPEPGRDSRGIQIPPSLLALGVAAMAAVVLLMLRWRLIRAGL
jgi:hypothetical protein